MDLNKLAEGTIVVPEPKPGYHKGYTLKQQRVVNTMQMRQRRAIKRSEARGDSAHLIGWIQS